MQCAGLSVQCAVQCAVFIVLYSHEPWREGEGKEQSGASYLEKATNQENVGYVSY